MARIKLTKQVESLENVLEKLEQKIAEKQEKN